MSALLTAVTGAVAVFTLNRPEARNALSVALRDELEAGLLAFDADPALRVAIVAGAGQQAFCAGADLKAAPVAPSIYGPGNRSLVCDLGLSKPVIAAVNGAAFGGGLELALLCDIRIASTAASFALSEVRIGSLAGSGGTQRLPRLIGLGAALHFGLTGDRIGAAEALALGLVTRVVEPDALAGAAMEVAERIAANAPLSVQATKKAMREGLEMPLAEGLAHERLLFSQLRDSADRAEGRAAFREKRPAVFTGQ